MKKLICSIFILLVHNCTYLMHTNRQPTKTKRTYTQAFGQNNQNTQADKRRSYTQNKIIRLQKEEANAAYNKLYHEITNKAVPLATYSLTHINALFAKNEKSAQQDNSFEPVMNQIVNMIEQRRSGLFQRIHFPPYSTLCNIPFFTTHGARQCLLFAAIRSASSTQEDCTLNQDEKKAALDILRSMLGKNHAHSNTCMNDETPLLYAVELSIKDATVIQILLDYGAKPFKRYGASTKKYGDTNNPRYITPLQYAQKIKNYPAIKFLEDAEMMHRAKTANNNPDNQKHEKIDIPYSPSLYQDY